MLAFIGGYLEAYAWIIHRVFANAQGANLVFLWGYMTSGELLLCKYRTRYPA